MPVVVKAAKNPRLGWNAHTRAQLQSYLEQAMALLRLSDYELEVDLAEPTDGSCATVVTIAGQHRATLHLAPEFLTKPVRWQQETLLHELLHLHINPLVHLVESILDGIIVDDAIKLVTNAVWAAAEYPVDTLAATLADLTAAPRISRDQPVRPQPLAALPASRTAARARP